uniref:Uncharacterized protein n=1 Tax=Romanomermis culicivorax TaxID=13658 RepID=A0A915JCL8_ROMCU
MEENPIEEQHGSAIQQLEDLISPQDDREQFKEVEAVATQSKACVLEKGQKENQETDKSVILEEQDNVQQLYPRKEGKFDKPGTSVADYKLPNFVGTPDIVAGQPKATYHMMHQEMCARWATQV